MNLEQLIAYPRSRTAPHPLLLIHGAWHGAWCWAGALADFAARGFEAHAVSLRGHGASPRPRGFWRTTVFDYLADLRAAVAAVGQPPILVGHSNGGYLTQLLITGRAGPPPPLAGAVLLCSTPIDIIGYFMRRRDPSSEPINPIAMLRREPAAMRATLFRRDIDPVTLNLYVNQMVGEPPLVPLSSMFLRPQPARSRTPALVIAADRDAVFDVTAQRTTAAAYGADLVIIPEATHSLMLDPAWPMAADAIERFAAGLR